MYLFFKNNFIQSTVLSIMVLTIIACNGNQDDNLVGQSNSTTKSLQSDLTDVEVTPGACSLSVKVTHKIEQGYLYSIKVGEDQRNLRLRDFQSHTEVFTNIPSGNIEPIVKRAGRDLGIEDVEVVCSSCDDPNYGETECGEGNVIEVVHGGCKLNDAIAAANSNLPAGQCSSGSANGIDTIVIVSDKAIGPYHFGSPAATNPLVIADDLIIEGGTPSRKSIINTQLKSAIFVTEPHVSLTLRNLSLVNAGYQDVDAICDGTDVDALLGGGAVRALGPLAIDDVSFINNYSKCRGGAIAAYDSLDVSNAVFENNRSLDGGAIYAQPSGHVSVPLNIAHSVFENNTGTDSHLAHQGVSQVGRGGAVSFINNDPSGLKLLSIDKSVFRSNSAGSAGAIYVKDENVSDGAGFVCNPTYSPIPALDLPGDDSCDLLGSPVQNPGFQTCTLVQTKQSRFDENHSYETGGVIQAVNAAANICQTSMFNNSSQNGTHLVDVSGTLGYGRFVEVVGDVGHDHALQQTSQNAVAIRERAGSFFNHMNVNYGSLQVDLDSTSTQANSSFDPTVGSINLDRSVLRAPELLIPKNGKALPYEDVELCIEDTYVDVFYDRDIGQQVGYSNVDGESVTPLTLSFQSPYNMDSKVELLSGNSRGGRLCTVLSKSLIPTDGSDITVTLPSPFPGEPSNVYTFISPQVSGDISERGFQKCLESGDTKGLTFFNALDPLNPSFGQSKQVSQPNINTTGDFNAGDNMGVSPEFIFRSLFLPAKDYVRKGDSVCSTPLFEAGNDPTMVQNDDIAELMSIEKLGAFSPFPVESEVFFTQLFQLYGEVEYESFCKPELNGWTYECQNSSELYEYSDLGQWEASSIVNHFEKANDKICGEFRMIYQLKDKQSAFISFEGTIANPTGDVNDCKALGTAWARLSSSSMTRIEKKDFLKDFLYTGYKPEGTAIGYAPLMSWKSLAPGSGGKIALMIESDFRTFHTNPDAVNCSEPVDSTSHSWCSLLIPRVIAGEVAPALLANDISGSTSSAHDFALRRASLEEHFASGMASSIGAAQDIFDILPRFSNSEWWAAESKVNWTSSNLYSSNMTSLVPEGLNAPEVLSRIQKVTSCIGCHSEGNDLGFTPDGRMSPQNILPNARADNQKSTRNWFTDTYRDGYEQCDWDQDGLVDPIASQFSNTLNLQKAPLYISSTLYDQLLYRRALNLYNQTRCVESADEVPQSIRYIDAQYRTWAQQTPGH